MKLKDFKELLYKYGFYEKSYISGDYILIKNSNENVISCVTFALKEWEQKEKREKMEEHRANIRAIKLVKRKK